jgi:hypothetical protein
MADLFSNGLLSRNNREEPLAVDVGDGLHEAHRRCLRRLTANKQGPERNGIFPIDSLVNIEFYQ